MGFRPSLICAHLHTSRCAHLSYLLGGFPGLHLMAIHLRPVCAWTALVPLSPSFPLTGARSAESYYRLIKKPSTCEATPNNDPRCGFGLISSQGVISDLPQLQSLPVPSSSATGREAVLVCWPCQSAKFRLSSAPYVDTQVMPSALKATSKRIRGDRCAARFRSQHAPSLRSGSDSSFHVR